jgi:hypothetical protein
MTKGKPAPNGAPLPAPEKKTALKFNKKQPLATNLDLAAVHQTVRRVHRQHRLSHQTNGVHDV